MFDVETVAGFGEGEGLVAGSVTGHDASNLDAEVVEVGDGCLEKGNGTFLFLVREDADAGEAGIVVDGNVSKFPAGSSPVVALVGLAVSVSGDAVACSVELSELLDIDVDDLAGRLALVARARPRCSVPRE